MVAQLSPVTLVFGGDTHLNNQTVRRLCMQAQEALPEAEVTEIDATSCNAYEFNEALSPGFLSEQAIVIVRHIHHASRDVIDAIVHFMQEEADPATHTGSVVIAQQVESSAQSVATTLQQAGIPVITVDSLDNEHDRVQYTKQCFAAYKRVIELPAAQYIAAATTPQTTDQIEALAHQLCSDFDTNPIGIDLVQQYMVATPQFKSFSIVNTALAGRGAQAVAECREALQQGMAPIAIIGACASTLRSMAKVAAMQSGLITAREVGSKGMIAAARRQLVGWNTPSMAICFEQLAYADAVAKGAPGDVDLALETALLSLATKGQYTLSK